MKSPLHWSLYFVFWIIGLVLTGAVLGSLAFVLFGLVVQPKFTLGELAMHGMRTGSFFFMVWAPGVAIVATVMRVKRLRDNRKSNLG